MEENSEELKYYIEHFDNIFGTNAIKHIKFKNMKILKLLIEYFLEDLYKPSSKYEKLRREHIEISDEIETTLTENQKKLFEKYYDISNRMTEELEEQLFMFGYIFGSEMKSDFELGVKHNEK